MNSQLYRATKFFTFFTFAFGLLIPVLPSFFSGFGFSDAQLGWIYSILPFMMFLMAPIAGNLSDKLGRRLVLFIAIVLDILAVSLYIFIDNGLVAVFARVFDCMAIATVITVSIARVQDSVSDESRGKLSGQAFSFQSIAKISAPLLGGFLADFLFTRAPFILTLILLIMLIRIPKKPRQTITKHDLKWFGTVRAFLGFRKLRGMALLGIVHHMCFPAIEFFLPLLIVREFGLSFFFVGLALFIHRLPTVLQFIFGRFSDRSPPGFVIFGSVLVGLATLLVAFAGVYWVLVIVLFLRGVGNSIWNVSAWNLMARVGNKHSMHGKVIGSYISIAKLGAFIASPVSGMVVMYAGVNNLFIFLGALLFFGVLISIPFIRDSL